MHLPQAAHMTPEISRRGSRTPHHGVTYGPHGINWRKPSGRGLLHEATGRIPLAESHWPNPTGRIPLAEAHSRNPIGRSLGEPPVVRAVRNDPRLRLRHPRLLSA